MPGYISCGKIYYYLSFPFLAPIFCFWMGSILTVVLPQKWHAYYFHKIVFIALGQMILGIIVETLFYFKRKKKKNRIIY